MHLRIYTDSSFANNADGTTQLGYVILIADRFGNASIISFRSYKCRRRVRSILGGEAIAFIDGFDQGFLLRAQLRALLGRTLPMRILTDSASLYHVMTRATLTTERRLIIDLMAARESYARGEISDIGLIRSQYNPADELTKDTDCSRLLAIMTSHHISHPVEEWVTRATTNMDAVNIQDAEHMATTADAPRSATATPRTSAPATPQPNATASSAAPDHSDSTPTEHVGHDPETAAAVNAAYVTAANALFGEDDSHHFY